MRYDLKISRTPVGAYGSAVILTDGGLRKLRDVLRLPGGVFPVSFAKIYLEKHAARNSGIFIISFPCHRGKF